MNLKNALKSFIDGDEERAVSPVIGVILMVAITVILAAVIGTFVLGLGDRVSEASPNTNFGFDYGASAGNADSVEIVHDGGDGVESEQLKVTVGGDTVWDGSDSGFANIADYTDGGNSTWSGKISAGDKLDVAEDGGNIQDGDAVKIIWTASGSDKTAVIGESEVNV